MLSFRKGSMTKDEMYALLAVLRDGYAKTITEYQVNPTPQTLEALKIVMSCRDYIEKCVLDVSNS